MKISKKESHILTREKTATSRNTTTLIKPALTNWKRKDSGYNDPKINEGLRKIFVNSILWNYDKGNFTETHKELKKYFLIDKEIICYITTLNHENKTLNNSNITSEKIKNKSLTFNNPDLPDSPRHTVNGHESFFLVKPNNYLNNILYNIFYALLMWKHNNSCIFFEILFSTIELIEYYSSLNEEIYNLSSLDENILKLFKKFLSPPLHQQINSSYQQIFSDKNLKLFFNSSEHYMTMIVILLMIFITIFKKPSMEKNGNSTNVNGKIRKASSVTASPVKRKESRVEIKTNLNNILSEKMCKNKNCVICGKEFIGLLLFKTNSFSQSQTILIDPEDKLFNNKRRKSIEVCSSPIGKGKNFESANPQKKNSALQKYIQDASGCKPHHEEEILKLSTNSRSKSALSGPTNSNKIETQQPKPKIQITRRDIITKNNLPRLSFSTLSGKNSDLKERNEQNTFRNSSALNFYVNKKPAIEANKNSRNITEEIAKYQTDLVKKTPILSTMKSESPKKPEYKIDSLVSNLQKEIQNMDDILKSYTNNLKTIRSELLFLET